MAGLLLRASLWPTKPPWNSTVAPPTLGVFLMFTHQDSHIGLWHVQTLPCSEELSSSSTVVFTAPNSACCTILPSRYLTGFSLSIEQTVVPLVLELLPYRTSPGYPFMDILLERVMKFRSRSATEVDCELVHPKAETLPAHVCVITNTSKRALRTWIPFYLRILLCSFLFITTSFWYHPSRIRS